MTASADGPRTLWTDDVDKRFYLVPDDVELPPGPLNLRAGATQRVAVDPAAAASFEVSREEAKAFLDQRFDAFVDDVKDAFGGFLERFRAGVPEPEASDATHAEEPPDAPGPGTKLFSALTGVPEDALRENPEGFAHGLRNLTGHESEGAARSEEEKEQLEASAERLERLAAEVDEAAAHAGARLRSLLRRLETLDQVGHPAAEPRPPVEPPAREPEAEREEP